MSVSPTLAEIRSMTPDRAVSDDELTGALNACLDHMEEAKRGGRFDHTERGLSWGGEWYEELCRLMSTYAPYFAWRVTGRS